MRNTFVGLSAQMKRLNVISENVANANRVADPNGDVYKKKRVLETGGRSAKPLSFTDHMTLSLARSRKNHIQQSSQNQNFSIGRKDPMPFKVIEVDGERKIFDPSNPKADQQGYVRMPEINVVEEMVNMVNASRSFEANVNVLDAAKQMAKKALEI
ncbi:MAG: flagellar basal body rod protein FlgC [FCB group bacterium]|nr:flagellar basal body rod protein FlgC [FCB group bacterium]